MAVRPVNQFPYSDPNYPNDFGMVANTQEYHIQGKPVSVERTLSSSMVNSMDLAQLQDVIKETLCQMLVQEMLKEKLIEFTSQYIPQTDEKVFRARIFVTPDTQVRILRIEEIIK